MKPQIRQVTSLFLLCQVLLILTHEPLVKVLSWIILEGDADVFTAAGAAKISLYTQSKVRWAQNPPGTLPETGKKEREVCIVCRSPIQLRRQFVPNGRHKNLKRMREFVLS